MIIAVQMYTVRDECAKDFLGTLSKVAEMGYKAVEMAGLYDLSPETVKAHLDAVGLKVASSHEGFDAVTTDIDGVLACNRTLGNTNIVCPWAPLSQSADPADWDKLASALNEAGRRCHEAGFTFAYHNHAHEFQLVEGRPGIERLLEATNPEYVKMEADMGWVWFAGADPAEFLRKHAGRVPLIHAKDHDKADRTKNRPVGDGALDWKAIFSAAAEAGTQIVVVEEDVTILPCLESVAKSLANLKAMGVA